MFYIGKEHYILNHLVFVSMPDLNREILPDWFGDSQIGRPASSRLIDDFFEIPSTRCGFEIFFPNSGFGVIFEGFGV